MNNWRNIFYGYLHSNMAQPRKKWRCFTSKIRNIRFSNKILTPDKRLHLFSILDINSDVYTFRFNFLFFYDRLSASLHQCSLISFTPGTSQREFQGKLTSAGALLNCNSCLFFHVWDPEGSICNLAPKCVTQDTENWTEFLGAYWTFSYKYKVIWRFLNREHYYRVSQQIPD